MLACTQYTARTVSQLSAFTNAIDSNKKASRQTLMAALAQDGVKICRSTLNRAKQVANGADGVFV